MFLHDIPKAAGIGGKVYSPKRIKIDVDVNAAIEEWEADVEMFTKLEKHELNPVSKIYAIRQIVPEELEKDIIRNTSLDTYEKVRTYIFGQVANRRDNKNASKGPIQMELNAMLASMINEKGHESEERQKEGKR